jgi:hypothetical protein
MMITSEGIELAATCIKGGNYKAALVLDKRSDHKSATGSIINFYTCLLYNIFNDYRKF